MCLSHGKQIVAKIAQPGNVRAMETWLAPLAALFTQPTWLNVVALARGALLVVVLGLMGVGGTARSAVPVHPIGHLSKRHSQLRVSCPQYRDRH